MHSKERVLAAISGSRVDSTPSYYMGTKAINQLLAQKLGIPAVDLDLENRVGIALGVDAVFIRPAFAPEADGAISGFRTAEIHAKIHKEDGHESIEIPRAPLSEINDPEEISEIDCWPDPDAFCYTIPEEVQRYCLSHGVVARGNNAMFLSAAGLRGMEQCMMDMALSPEMMHAILDRITSFHEARIERFLDESGDYIDVVDIGDDVAGQTGMLFSLEMWREFLKPYMLRLTTAIKRHGKKTLFFGCGGFRDIIPDLIEMGVECAGRMQTEAAGNDFAGLKADFGERICIWGALDAQHALIEGNVESCVSHTKNILSTADTGGFIAGPTHTFTEDTPVGNILAVYKTLSGCRES